jgi:uncharacterized protein with GYD domain
MNRYLLLIRSDAAGAARMLQALDSGYQELPSAVRRFGGTVERHYALAGRFDAALIVQFESPQGVLAYTLAAGAQGQTVEAIPAFAHEELAEVEDVALGASEAFLQDMQGLLEESEGGAG